jgi:hypothetical protein
MSNSFIKGFLDYRNAINKAFHPEGLRARNRSPQVDAIIDFFKEYGEFLEVDPKIIVAAVEELEGENYSMERVKIHFAESFLKEATRTFLDEQKMYYPER